MTNNQLADLLEEAARCLRGLAREDAARQAGFKERHFSVNDAVKVLGLNAWTIRDKARKNLIPATKVHGDWTFCRDTLEDYLSGQRRRGANSSMKRLMKSGFAQ